MSATVRQRDFEEYARAGRQRLYRTAYLLSGDREHARGCTVKLTVGPDTAARLSPP
ncbi:hypothetical protein [Streptomyces turgidiscabies]|uniref:Uncharacterized protein n=1 Tax=Streptomyces turgidiscabies TaxID=85558 RepID=A0ABU0RJ61_9ACTN|nr:hypothetical protein [Streptomyces turgidiscabies]MDQ0932035.1 hypothetical protein [Streptomyces turgidiscabies]